MVLTGIHRSGRELFETDLLPVLLARCIASINV
jgi:hypothetical protein